MKYAAILAVGLFLATPAQAETLAGGNCDSPVLLSSGASSRDTLIVIQGSCASSERRSQVIHTFGDDGSASTTVVIRRTGKGSSPARVIKVENRDGFSKGTAAKLIRVGE